jgi:hypothetical protein
MNEYITLFITTVGLLFFARFVAHKTDRVVVVVGVLVFLLLSMTILHMVDMQKPFAGGGDDEMYYLYSYPSAHYGQGSYIMILSIWRQLVSDSLYACKALNLFFYVLTALIWYRIGIATYSRRLALLLLFAVLLTSTFWVYYWFLLKDMTITLLMSVFILFLLLFLQTSRFIYSVLTFTAVILIIAFRFYYGILALTIFGASVAIGQLQAKSRNKVHTVLFLIIGLILMSVIISKTSYLESLGVAARPGVTTQGIIDSVEGYKINYGPMDYNIYGIPSFISIFITWLTGGMGTNAVSFQNVLVWDLEIIIERLNLPWLLVGIPFYVVGVYALLTFIFPTLIRRWGGHNINPERIGINESSARLLAIVCLVFMGLFLLMFFVYPSNAGGRYQLQALPVMVATACVGWLSMDQLRGKIAILWICLIVSYHAAVALFKYGF